MSVSKEWVSNQSNRAAVVALYRSRECLTAAKIAERLGTSAQNVCRVVNQCIPEAERKALRSVKYSASKAGPKNPNFGKRGSRSANWKGVCEDGRGYLTILRGKRRVFLHHAVMADSLGLKFLPRWAVVHHIDGNPHNNDPDNLALVTKAGHQHVHYMQVKDSAALACKKRTLAEAVRYMTSQ